MNTYIKKIRSKIGTDSFICPAARIIVQNKKKEFLIIERKDNSLIGLPAGSIEENETIKDCIIREVKEETGIEILSLEVIGISSNPQRESVEYPNGDKIQYFTVEFYSDDWRGDINVEDEAEVRSAMFAGWDRVQNLPPNELSTFDSLEYYHKENRILLK